MTTDIPPASSPLLDVDGVHKHFVSRAGWSAFFGKGGRGGKGSTEAAARITTLRAVDGVSLQLWPGETLGLVGESGSGKSTLGRLIVKLADPTGGAIRLHGVDLARHGAAEDRAMRRAVQMVFQDPYGSLDPRRSIAHALAEPLKVHRLWTPSSPAKIEALMRTVGLDPAHANRYPHQFSGGQRQRIGIARALTLDPRILVLDEPVSALDVSIQAQIINLLQALQRERGLAYLFIAHDLAVVRHVSHRVAVMYLGRVVEMADSAALYDAPLHPYTASLLSAVPVPDPARERTRARVTAIGEIGSAARLPSGCRFHPRCPRAREVASNSAENSAGSSSANTAHSPAGAHAPPSSVMDTPYGRLPAVCVGVDPALTSVASATDAARPLHGAAFSGRMPIARAVACHFPLSSCGPTRSDGVAPCPTKPTT